MRSPSGTSCGGQQEVIVKHTGSTCTGAYIIDNLRKFWRLSWRDRFLLSEAVLGLGIAGLAIAVLPFRSVGFLAGRPIRRPELPRQERLNNVQRIRWAITRAAARVPWRTMCFEQGLAAQLMLRRRGIPAVLYYGAKQDDHRGLNAHVWVCDGEVEVIGAEIADQFVILTTFPPQESDALELH